MSNYCSIGLDAKLGHMFDKNRTKSRILNKLVYVWEAMKNFCVPEKTIKSVIAKMDQIVEYEKLESEVNEDEVAGDKEKEGLNASGMRNPEKPKKKYKKHLDEKRINNWSLT